MGAREGTRPEDDPLTRSLSAKAEARGDAKGQAKAVLATLRARGIHTGADFAADLEPFAALELETLIAAALACTDEADFRRRIGEARA